jgi:endonuclease/exonuclease/phosphatase family metal-dependent hydrolase
MTLDLNEVRGLRDIAGLMLQPPVDPASGRVGAGVGRISVRELVDRHRFLSGEQPSVEEVVRRWRAAEGSTALHVLAFNTFLMNVKINVFDELDKILPGGDVSEGLVGALIGLAVGGPVGLLGGAIAGLEVSAARELLEKASGSLSDISLRKPDVETRRSEVGTMLADEGFDVAALSEVWAAAERNAVLDAIRARGVNPAGVAQGALPGKSYAGSGLMTVGFGQPLGEAIFRPYKSTGSANQDTDYYAERGALLSRIPLEFGEIDLYSTHIYFGNDLPATPVTDAPSEDERVAWRTLQVRELQAFIAETHKAANVAVLVGDFNIDAYGGTHYGGAPSLAESTGALGLEDQWVQQFPSDLARGGTDCALSESSIDCVASSRTPADDQPRIDYLFVERPTPEHTFNVDVSRIILRDFPRASYRENQASLSDHRGLDFHLLCSPKAG